MDERGDDLIRFIIGEVMEGGVVIGLASPLPDSIGGAVNPLPNGNELLVPLARCRWRRKEGMTGGARGAIPSRGEYGEIPDGSSGL